MSCIEILCEADRGRRIVGGFAGKSDPYVILSIGKEQRKSKVAKGKVAAHGADLSRSTPIVWLSFNLKQV